MKNWHVCALLTVLLMIDGSIRDLKQDPGEAFIISSCFRGLIASILSVCAAIEWRKNQ